MATPSILLESLPSLIHTINLLSWPHPPYYLKAYRAQYYQSVVMATPSILLESLLSLIYTINLLSWPHPPYYLKAYRAQYYQSVVMATPSILLESLPSLIYTINLLSWPHPPYYLKAYRASYILSICCHGHTLHIRSGIRVECLPWYICTFAHICSQINHKTARHIAVSLI